MELKSPPPCPATVTVRRNPPRRARPTPSSAVPLREPLSSPSISRDIFAAKITQQNPNNADSGKIDSSTITLPENLKVFLRIRPPTIQKIGRAIAESKNAWPKNPKVKSNARPKTKKSSEICVQANDDLRSVTVSTPQSLQEMKRIKSEVYEGFSYVFTAESSQNDVYDEMVKPLVEDFLKGKSGMLAALGPSGSGKTHTVFGCPRQPGMVPLALRRIFSEDESSTAQLSRVVYLSMFEISSERGKGEKMIDLLHDGVDVCLQHSVIKGLREAVISDAQQAESLIARGMLKRATAMTNSNSQSSRSQCIINLRCGSKQGCEEVDGNASNTTLTIVDLAGAEREKKTGNQGARLLESNFINNTSMVFGQCLRSLLEHQKNRNKTLQKHYKNSLLTRYLRDYLEGKKRMMLILTVKPGVEDYLDTSFLLRQASPFAKIKFKTVEEPVNLTNKRPNQALPQPGQLKRMKLGSTEISLIDEGKIDRSFPQILEKETSEEAIEGCRQNIPVMYDVNDNEIHALSNGFSKLGIQEKMSRKGNDSKLKLKKDREYRIMQGLSKGLWNVLKQYKEKLEGIEIENCHLRDSLANAKTRSLDLENELTNKKMRILDLENEVKELKSLCTCCSKPSSNVFRESAHGPDFNLLQCQMAETPKVKFNIVSPSSRRFDKTENEIVADPSAKDSAAILASCSDGGDEQQQKQLEDISESRDDTENSKGLRDTSKVDTCFNIKVPSASIDSSRELVFCEDMCKVDIPSISEAALQSTCRSLYISRKSDQEALNIVRYVKNLESGSESCLVDSLECESNRNTQYYEDLKDAKQQQLEDISESRDDTENSKGLSDTSKVDACFNIKVPSASIDSSRELVLCEDMCKVDIPSTSEAAIQSTCRSLYISHKSDQEALDIVGDVKNLESGSESCLVDSLECESNRNIQDYEDLKGAKQQQLEDISESREDIENAKGFRDTSKVDPCFNIKVPSASIDSSRELVFCEDMCIVDIPSTSEASIQSTCRSFYISHKSDQEALNIVGDVKNLESGSESCLVDSLECENNRSTQDYEDIKDAEQELTQLQSCMTDNSTSLVEEHTSAYSHVDLKSSESLWNGDACTHANFTDNRKSLVEEQNVPMASHSHAVDLKSSKSPWNGDTCNHVKEEGTLKPLGMILPKEGLDAQNVPKFVPKVASCNNQLTKKPKRRLQPASSVLLKDLNLLDIKDENDKPKGAKAGMKRATTDEKSRTQGSLSLLNLLTSKLDR